MCSSRNSVGSASAQRSRSSPGYWRRSDSPFTSAISAATTRPTARSPASSSFCSGCGSPILPCCSAPNSTPSSSAGGSCRPESPPNANCNCRPKTPVSWRRTRPRKNWTSNEAEACAAPGVGACALEGVPDSAGRELYGQEVGQLLNPASLPRALVANVPLSALAALELLQVRAPQHLLGFRMPAEVDVVQAFVVG